MRIASLFLALAAFAGCSSAPPHDIHVAGVPSSLAQIAGSWQGDYRTTDGGRHGTITFDLAPGDTVASGSVIMSAVSEQVNTRPSSTSTAPAPGAHAAPAATTLAVRFVETANGLVRGQLDPYTDPECACEVATVFEGRVRGDRIEGTFTIRNLQTQTSRQGRWSVTRQAKEAQ